MVTETFCAEETFALGRSIGEKAKPGRYTLYPTDNMWTFLMLDQIDGTVYQVQWSQKADSRGVIKIE